MHVVRNLKFKNNFSCCFMYFRFCMETNFIDDLSPLWQFDAVHEKRSRVSKVYNFFLEEVFPNLNY